MPQHNDPEAVGIRGIGVIRPHRAQGRGSAQKKENSKIGRGKTIQNMLTFKVRIHVFAAKRKRIVCIIEFEYLQFMR